MQINPSISKSAQFGNLRFPVREDYVKYFLDSGVVATEKDLWKSDKFVSLIHRHWHGEGRNGCIFALLAARKPDEIGWKDFVVTGSIDEIESGDTETLLKNLITLAISDPNCQVLSLLFSNIYTDNDLVRLIRFLLNMDIVKLVDEQEIDDLVTLSLRIPLNSDNVLSWLMAFGPYDYFPQTRQSPITEVAIRVKTKPDIQFHRLNKDNFAAHLADLPLEYKDEVMEKTWENTLKRTRYILGEEPNQFSAAKTTFILPIKIWKSLI